MSQDVKLKRVSGLGHGCSGYRGVRNSARFEVEGVCGGLLSTRTMNELNRIDVPM